MKYAVEMDSGATLLPGEINTGTWSSRLDARQKLKRTDPTSRQRGRPTSIDPKL
jgi:hypothetical protein